MESEVKRLREENDNFQTCNCMNILPLAERYKIIESQKDQYSIHALCRILQVRRSAFYHYLYRSSVETLIEKEDKTLRPKIKEIFEWSKERFGSRKIRAQLMDEGIEISQKRITKLMTKMNLVCKPDSFEILFDYQSKV